MILTFGKISKYVYICQAFFCQVSLIVDFLATISALPVNESGSDDGIKCFGLNVVLAFENDNLSFLEMSRGAVSAEFFSVDTIYRVAYVQTI